MTGFGAAQQPWPEEDLLVTVEVRSVNARYRDVRVRSDLGLAAEHAVAAAVAERVGRGRVTAAVLARPLGETGAGAEARIAARLDRAIHRYGRLATLAGNHGLSLAAPAARDLLALVGPDAAPAPGAPPFLADLTARAVEALVRARRAEGAALEAALRAVLDDLAGTLEALGPALEARRGRIAEDLAERVADLSARGLAAPDRERLEQEVAALLVRGDPREEQDRLAAHVARARSILDEPAAAGQGRRLEFLGQEMSREAGTLAAKASGAGADDLLLRVRLCVDRFREQVQNVE